MSKIMYTVNGEEVEVIEELKSGGYLCEHIYEYEDGSLIQGDVERIVVYELYDDPPTKRISEEIKRLAGIQASLLKSNSALERNIRDKEEEYNRKMEKFKKIEELKYLDWYIDGKISYFVVVGYRTVDIKDMDFIKDRWGNIKLLVLMSDSECVKYGLNDYSDGSGSVTRVFPCISLEQAKDIQLKYIKKQIEDLEKKYSHWDMGSLLKTFKKYQQLDITIPDELIKKYNDKEIKDLEETKKCKEAEIKQINDKIEKVMARYER